MPQTPVRSNPRRSWRLLLLTALVLLAHWAVLRAAPLALASHANAESDASWVFATRTIAAPDPAQRVLDSAKPALVAPIRKAPELRPAPVPAPTPAAPPQMDADSAANPVLNEPPAIEAVAPTPEPAAAPLAAATVVAAATETGTVALAMNSTTQVAPAAPPPAQAVRKFVVPPSTRLKYDVRGESKGFPYFANGELRWVQDGKTYDARMEISMFLLGSRVQTSVGQVTPHGLAPTRFGDKFRSEVAAHFDHEKNKVSFSANTPDVPLLPGGQDQLSALMQLAAMIAAQPSQFVVGTTLPIQAVGPRSAESWVFTVGATEKLTLPGGELSTLRLSRDAPGEYAPKMELWLAPSLGYLPVRIRLTQANGEVLDQQWRSTQAP